MPYQRRQVGIASPAGKLCGRGQQAQRPRFPQANSLHPAGADSPLLEMPLHLRRQHLVRHADHYLIRAELAAQLAQPIRDRLRLIHRTVHLADILVGEGNLHVSPPFRDQASQRVKEAGHILRSDHPGSDAGPDLVEHLPQGGIQIHRPEQDDVALGAYLPKLDGLQAGGLPVPQAQLGENPVVVFLDLGQGRPALGLGETIEVLTLTADAVEIQGIGRQFDVQAAEDIAKLEPAEVVFRPGRPGNNLFAPVFGQAAQGLRPRQLLGQFIRERPLRQVKLLRQLALRDDFRRREAKALILRQVCQQLLQPPARTLAGHDHDDPAEIERLPLNIARCQPPRRLWQRRLVPSEELAVYVHNLAPFSQHGNVSLQFSSP